MARRITLLYSITELPVGGTEQQLLELVRGLDRTRFRPIVLNLKPGGPLEREFTQVPGVRVISLDRTGRRSPIILLKICSILRRMKVDVVQPFMTPAILLTLVSAFLCRTPVKTITERSGPGRRKETPLRYRLYLAMEDFLGRFVDLAITNSEAGKRYLVERGIGPERVKVIYNGINLTRLGADEDEVMALRERLGLSQEGKVVGMIASMYPVKNHAIFIQAAAVISQSIPDVKFVIVGNGPLRGYLENLSRDLDLASKVIFCGDHRDPGTYLSVFDIAVVTSDVEGCCNVLLEAMALGKPVVATNVGGNPELVRHEETGILVPPRDIEALAKAIIGLLDNTETRDAMGRRARDEVTSRFTVENMVRQHELLYEESLRGRHERKESR